MYESPYTQQQVVNALIGEGPGGRPPPVAWILSALYEIDERGPRAHDPDPAAYAEMKDELFKVMFWLCELYWQRYGEQKIPTPHKPLGPVDTSRRKAEVARRLLMSSGDGIPF